MKALVIGGAGFIGSNLIKALLQQGHKVVSLDNYLSGTPENHHAGASYVYGCASCVHELSVQADVVFHLGEYSRVEQSDDEPWTCLSNTYATIPSVLRYCHEQRAKLIYSGSSTKFSAAQSPYVVAKRLNTELVMLLCEQFSIPYAITYFYNVYGPGEISQGRYATVVAKFIHAAINGLAVDITGSGRQRRHFTHVDDVVSALLLICEKGHGDGYGIGADEDLSIIELANRLGLPYRLTDDKPSNRLSSVLITDKTKALGWSAKTSLTDYLRGLDFTASNGSEKCHAAYTL